ncbi:MAG: hypothetical protein IMW98_07525 [Firmicutes bacterium]|nr:hypothetical protein [Bacillota bacterium]
MAQLAEMDCLLIHAGDLSRDLRDLEHAYPDAHAHWTALAAILHQLRIVHTRRPGKDLTGRFQGWRRHAFPARPERRARADLRIVYRPRGDRTEMLGFGHRHAPADVYRRLSTRPAGRP